MSLQVKLSASLEDYLEAIYHIIAENRVARAKDIVQRLGVGNSSVTGALRTLAAKELINYAPYELITMTEQGRTAARNIIRRHSLLRDFFGRVLNLEANTAEEAACRMEHSISQDVLERFTEFVNFLDACPRAGKDWLQKFHDPCTAGTDHSECADCISDCMKAFERGRTA